MVEPFLRFSIYLPEKDNDKLAELVQQHCSIKIFKLFEHVKTKMRLQDEKIHKAKKRLIRRNLRSPSKQNKKKS
jgi:hypothetical protein